MSNKLAKIALPLLLLGLALPIASSAQNAAYYPTVEEKRTRSTNFSFTQDLNFWKIILSEIAVAPSEIPPPSLSAHIYATENNVPSYNIDHLAFFCRLEVHLEKATKIPVRFRIGDVQQVDYLEGKFTGWRYGY